MYEGIERYACFDPSINYHLAPNTHSDNRYIPLKLLVQYSDEQKTKYGYKHLEGQLVPWTEMFSLETDEKFYTPLEMISECSWLDRKYVQFFSGLN